MKIELQEWAKTQYVNPPTNKTLVNRFRRGELKVQLVKEGPRWYVELNNWADEVVRAAS